MTIQELIAEIDKLPDDAEMQATKLLPAYGGRGVPLEFAAIPQIGAADLKRLAAAYSELLTYVKSLDLLPDGHGKECACGNCEEYRYVRTLIGKADSMRDAFIIRDGYTYQPPPGAGQQKISTEDCGCVIACYEGGGTVWKPCSQHK